jgi:aromatic amino acid aminotransferase I
MIATAGMFIFLAIHISHHPSYPHMLKRSTPAEATRILMDKLWHELAENHVLVAPGWGFDANGVHNIGGDGVGYFRLSYSTMTYAQCRTAMKIFSEQLDKFFKIK